MTDNLIITIGRQFGSGGRELGRKVAERLGIAYFDKELLSLAARQGGMSEEYIRENDERTPSLISPGVAMGYGFSSASWYQMPSMIGRDSTYSALSEAIRQIAADGPCVIVGRTADYILRAYPRMISVFVHAPKPVCVERIMTRGEVANPAEAAKLWDKTNKLRSNFYNFYTDKTWGDVRGYDLCFDTSVISIDDIADLIADYAKRRFAL